MGNPGGASGILLFDPSFKWVFLLQRALHTNSGLVWSIPGGHVEPDDSSTLDAALREFEEECGSRPLFSLKHKHTFDGYTTFVAVYNASLPWEPTLNHEHIDHNWFHISSLPENVHPGVIKVLLSLGLGPKGRY